MATYDQKEIKRLTDEYKASIRKAFETYMTNIEEIYNYGCDHEIVKENFILECKQVLNKSPEMIEIVR